MANIRIPTPLRPYTGGQSELQASGKTVAEALQELAGAYPDLSAQIFDGDGQLRPFVNLFLNNENIKDLEDVQTPLKENDRLLIIPSIAGGNQYQISNLKQPCYLNYPTKKFYATRATC